jgi:sugar phosphate permease
MPIVFSYFCEFLPPLRRGSLMALLAAFWMLGSMIVAAMAWTILGSVVSTALRTVLIVASVVAVVVSLFLFDARSFRYS